MTPAVTMSFVEARPTAVVAAETTWSLLPSLWPSMLDEVWACLRAAGITSGCPNVMLFRDSPGGVHLEVGVALPEPCPLSARVVNSVLPAGRVATTIHCGPYALLGAAHDAVAAWCDSESLQPTGTRWEIYGPHRDDPAELTTEIYWALADR